MFDIMLIIKHSYSTGHICWYCDWADTTELLRA